MFSVDTPPPGILTIQGTVGDDKSVVIEFLVKATVRLLYKKHALCRHVYGNWYHFSGQSGL